jgi:chromosome segregation ATPase
MSYPFLAQISGELTQQVYKDNGLMGLAVLVLIGVCVTLLWLLKSQARQNKDQIAAFTEQLKQADKRATDVEDRLMTRMDASDRQKDTELAEKRQEIAQLKEQVKGLEDRQRQNAQERATIEGRFEEYKLATDKRISELTQKLDDTKQLHLAEVRENVRLGNANVALQEVNKTLTEDNKRLLAENSQLKQEVQALRQRVERLESITSLEKNT